MSLSESDSYYVREINSGSVRNVYASNPDQTCSDEGNGKAIDDDDRDVSLAGNTVDVESGGGVAHAEKDENINISAKKTSREDVLEVQKKDDTLPPAKKFYMTRLMALLLLGVVEFLCGVALSILAPFYTSEATKHGLSVTGSSVVFATVFILQVVFTPLFGRFITKIGPVNLLVVGALCSGLANVGFGLVSSIGDVKLFFAMSILMRAITAIGESAINTAVYPLAGRMSPPNYSTTVLSCIETTFGLGSMVGPFFGGLLFDYGGFLLPFLVCGLLLSVSGLLAGGLICCLGRCKRRNEKKRLAEVHNNNTRNDDNNNIDDVKEVPRIRFRQIIKKPGVLVAVIIVVFSGISSQWYQPTLEPWLSSNYHITTFKAAMFLVIEGALYAVLSPIFGILLDNKLSVRLLLMFGCCCISGSFLLLGPFYFPGTPSLIQVGISLAIHGVGMAAVFIGTLTALTREISSKNLANKEGATGMATSIWITAECIGSFVGSALGGLTYEMLGWTMSCLSISLLQMLGLLVVVFYSMCLRLDKAKMARKADIGGSDERSPLLSAKEKDESAMPSSRHVVGYGSNQQIRV